MTPADEIKQAATRLRELATAASTDGRDKPTTRWHFKKCDNRGYLYAENPTGPGVRITPSTPANPGMWPRHGDYIATMDPTVGLALADWLDSWTGIDLRDDGPLPEDAQHALTVARALLGQPAPTQWYRTSGFDQHDDYREDTP
ncbi:hypothetical protein [Streptomyces murinus]|uniref:hypothetical protein n=1 Tax=Streptomyces murinus TaxID=33900 RepID=UPI00380591CF